MLIQFLHGPPMSCQASSIFASDAASVLRLRAYFPRKRRRDKEYLGVDNIL